jgi:hypothetical protein
MSDQDSHEERAADSIGEATSRIVELEAELEAAGEATTGADALADLKRELHDWVDSVTAVVATPGVGRVVLIHDNGRESRIASPDLPMRLSKPAKFTISGTDQS